MIHQSSREMLAVSSVLIHGFVAVPRLVQVRMCDDVPSTASSRTPSLLTELTENRWAATSTAIWEEMTEAYAAAAGVPYERAGPLQSASKFEVTDINLEQFTQLLLGLGDDLPEEKVKSLFDFVDADDDGKICYEQYYQAITEEASQRRSAGGFSFAKLFSGGGD